jgi:hypothetical protein
MAKKTQVTPSEPTCSFNPSTYLGGQAWIDEMDLVGRDMEAKWGADRLAADGRNRTAGQVRQTAAQDRHRHDVLALSKTSAPSASG